MYIIKAWFFKNFSYILNPKEIWDFFKQKQIRRCKIVTHKPKKPRDKKKIASRITIIALLLLSSKLGFDKYQLGNKLAKLEEDFKFASNKTNCPGEQIATEVGEVDIWDFPEETTQTTTDSEEKNVPTGKTIPKTDDSDEIIEWFPPIEPEEDSIVKEPEKPITEETEVEKKVVVIPEDEKPKEIDIVNIPNTGDNGGTNEPSYPDTVINDDTLNPIIDPDLEYDPEAVTVTTTFNIKKGD